MDVELEQTLRERALGFDTDEVVEEYIFQDGEAILTKRKVTRKKILPDMSAVKLLLENTRSIQQLSDDELNSQKLRLLQLLQGENDAKK